LSSDDILKVIALSVFHTSNIAQKRNKIIAMVFSCGVCHIPVTAVKFCYI